MKILDTLPYYKIVLDLSLERLIGASYRTLQVYPVRSTIVVRFYAGMLKEGVLDQVIAVCQGIAKEYGLPSVVVNHDRRPIMCAKAVYNDVLERYERRKAEGRKDSLYSLAKYQFLPKSARGCMLRIAGKKGLRTYRTTTVLGKVLRGTKNPDTDIYRGQVKDKRGVTGLTVTLLKSIPFNLSPQLHLKNCPPRCQNDIPYYSRYYRVV